jgi:3-dehydroquinate synthase
MYRDHFTVTDSLKQQIVCVSLGARSYEIVVCSDELPSLAGRMQKWIGERFVGETSGGTALIVTDGNVVRPHGAVVQRILSDAGWRVEMAELEPGETSKSLATAAGLYGRLTRLKADRRTIVLAVGGGVVGDVAGFVAATYARGIPFVQVPTTLLAQVDSSVGGKVGVNLPEGKNLVGAFHQPLGVFVDTATLDTLPDRDYQSGLAEVIKYGVILDDRFFASLEDNIEEIIARQPRVLEEIIVTCCRLKASIVEQDEEERTGLRAVLNYGHTFAHAFEALCGYGTLLHGEAVAVGMLCASRLAERMGRIDGSVTDRQAELIQAVGLPTMLAESDDLNVDAIVDCMKLDKKALAGTPRFVLPTRLGHAELCEDVAEDDIRDVLQQVLP